VREAVARARALGTDLRLIVLRLLAPTRPEHMALALHGAKRFIVVEQNHGAQLYRYLRAWYDFAAPPASYHRPGPLPLRPAELLTALLEWRIAK
jgi:2-oxoglutarate ferredoxin oxidoreductase subunit alpha